MSYFLSPALSMRVRISTKAPAAAAATAVRPSEGIKA
eukprot:CAMPEP_0171909814 /NCGR_PEP_ID=MMETSP0993-20121228/8977_1 /TAXON_ID=483369 /ORGANISM="non described non described, Strain CCMP2098" /LENGTH=36 /DNA_ID= /DNA_START= /DNA_END= /DNA_ORIENTATION=